LKLRHSIVAIGEANFEVALLTIGSVYELCYRIRRAIRQRGAKSLYTLRNSSSKLKESSGVGRWMIRSASPD